MGIYNLRDASLVVNSVNLSDHVREITITMNADDLDATAMGALSHTHVPGLRDDRMEVIFFQDHAAGSVGATLCRDVRCRRRCRDRRETNVGGCRANQPDIHDDRDPARLLGARRRGGKPIPQPGRVRPGAELEHRQSRRLDAAGGSDQGDARAAGGDRQGRQRHQEVHA